jgi:pSer/pThr/pTyr-binding forkhead associated (FHA) protein
MARLLLEIVEGPGAGRQVALTGPVVVGRDAEADVVLDDARVSRRHARIRPQEGRAVVEDLESRNGTFVNREEIHAPVSAAPGDDVLVGTTVLELAPLAVLARVEHRHQVLVAHLARRVGLAQEAPARLLLARQAAAHDLQRDRFGRSLAHGAKHLAHATLAQQRLDPVGPDDRPDRELGPARLHSQLA